VADVRRLSASAVIVLTLGTLTPEASIGFIAERRLDASRPRFVSVGGTVNYTWTIAAGTQLAETAGLVADVETAHDWRGTNTVTVTVAVTRLLTLKMSKTLEYRNTPVVGFGPLDTRTTAALVFSFERQPRP
jgi:hypothetical protein